MSSTAQEVYNEVIRALSPTERLRLATLILNELIQQNSPAIDQSDYWTEEDQADVANFSLQYATSLFPDEEAV
jgi:hypothetical protein